MRGWIARFHGTGPMKTISIKKVAVSIVFINNLSITAKQEYSDRIFKNQPNVFGYALALSDLDVSLVKNRACFPSAHGILSLLYQ
jgi:hypothetical protein